MTLDNAQDKIYPVPTILRAVEIDYDAVYWLISDGIPDEYGIEWEYEFYIEKSE